jgi:hypothetical protein
VDCAGTPSTVLAQRSLEQAPSRSWRGCAQRKMPRTVGAAFQEFCTRLEPTELQRRDAQAKHLGVRACVEERLAVDKSFLTGSYDRWTIVRPPSDIDLFVVLRAQEHADDYFHARGGAQAALERLHARLKRCYPDTPIRKDHPSVRLSFSTVGFDVIPAFNRNGGGFFIPKHIGEGWIPTDPPNHADRTTAMNGATSKYFIPVVKMFKSWNYAHYRKLSGFHIEMALVNAWPRRASVAYPKGATVVYGSYAETVTAVFPCLSAQLAYYTPDPAGLSGNIDEYLSAEDRQLTRNRLSAAGESAAVARRHETRGDHRAAITKWREVFGDTFPAYS